MADKTTGGLPAAALPLLSTDTVYVARGGNTFSKCAVADIVAFAGGTAVTDEFASGAGPFTLSQTPNSNRRMVFFDGVRQPATKWTITGTSLALAGGVDHTLFDTVSVEYYK